MHHHSAEFIESMACNPKHVALIIHMVLLGDYGKKAQAAARRALKAPKKAKLTRLTQLAGEHEFGVSSRAEVSFWNRMNKKQQGALDRAIMAEIKRYNSHTKMKLCR